MDYYKQKYLEFNQQYFLNRLPTNVRIVIRVYTARRGCIHIHKNSNAPYYAEIMLGKMLSEKEQLLTLKHEMVHLYCFIKDKRVGHTDYFWRLLKAIDGEPNLNYKTAEVVFGTERFEQRRMDLQNQKAEKEVITMAKETAEKVKKTPGTVKLVEMLQSGAYTEAELAEACGLSVNTVKVQISFHLKQKGYVIEKSEDGEFQITGKGEPLPPKPKKEKKPKAETPVGEAAEPSDPSANA